ncbi:MAG: tRNA 5-methylaminomethyl-2-thiouridine biosynthesis bifunctional protein [Pseudomonadota bacterium]|nr:tRNA 5-methylaminomethyl-2-thiouridine biosynthesis bifunctional protein [Pseudomonadota bacterium]
MPYRYGTEQNRSKQYIKPWYAIPNNHNSSKKVLIIGGGISGAATAYSLANRGYSVKLYEKSHKLASGASGNYQAILYNTGAGDYMPLKELSFNSYSYTNNLVKLLLTPGTEYQTSGLIQLAYNSKTLKQQQKILKSQLPPNFCYSVNKTQMQELSGVSIQCEAGIYYPHGMWLNPSSLIHKLANHPNIEVILNNQVINLELNKTNNNKFQWEIVTNQDVLDNAPNLVLCNSYLLNHFKQTANLKLHVTRGQISKIKNASNLNTIICSNGYVIPNLNDCYTIGATFKNYPALTSAGEDKLNIILDEHQENLSHILPYVPELSADINPNNIEGQANLRAHTHDYLPLVGPLANYTEFKQCYKSLALDANYKIETQCPYLPGLYINALFGSKGMLTAPMCGEIIADYIDNTPCAVSESLRQALHPNRLWIKDIIRSKIT